MDKLEGLCPLVGASAIVAKMIKKAGDLE